MTNDTHTHAVQAQSGTAKTDRSDSSCPQLCLSIPPEAEYIIENWKKTALKLMW